MEILRIGAFFFGFLGLGFALPIRTDEELQWNGGVKDSLLTHSSIFLALAVLICTVTGLLGCLCCQRRRLKHSEAIRNGNIKSGSINLATSGTEFTIFPPAGSTDPENASLAELKFEPLPDIRPRNRSSGSGPIQRPRPANFSTLINRGLSVDDWFEAPHNNFPRHQLQYLKEVGSGWFGQVVEGEAQGLLNSQKKTKVIVKILREDATPTDQMFFLHEVKPFRDLNHPNVMKLLGQCLESDPFLIILEYCTFKDLKTYLVQHRTESESLIQGNLLLQMACNIAAGLNYMHTHNFIHTDLAGRNCLVGADLSVKIGDYGSSIEKFKEDYYCAGDVAVPIRWCAPETLKCTETTIETKEVTTEANIWSFGIVVWEILEFGQTPYPNLHDEDVIEKVIIENSVLPEKPLTHCSHHIRMYEVMKLCWLIEPQLRPNMDKVNALLAHLYSHKDSESSDFEARWNQLQPRRNVRLTNLTDIHAGGDSGALQFDNDFANRATSSNKINDNEVLTNRELSPSPHPSLSLESDFHSVVKSSSISPSLQNLRGSFEDINENHLGFHLVDTKASVPSPVSQEIAEKNAFQLGEPHSSNWVPSRQGKNFDTSLEGEHLHSETGEESFFPSITTASSEVSQPEEISISVNSDNKMSTDDEETWKEIVESSKKEPGQITQMIREKSQSVQDFLKLTVIDSDNSDSDASASSKQLPGDDLASSSEGALSSVDAEHYLVQGSNSGMGVAIQIPQTDSFANGALVDCSQTDLESKHNQKDNFVLKNDKFDSNAVHSVSDNPSAIILIPDEIFLQQNLELDKNVTPISSCRDNLDSNDKTVSLHDPLLSDIMEKTNFPTSNPPEIVVQDVSLTPCDSSSNSVQGVGDSISEIQYEIDKPALNFRFVLNDTSSSGTQEKKTKRLHLSAFSDEDIDKEISLDDTFSRTTDHEHQHAKRLTSTPNEDGHSDSQYVTMENSLADNNLFYSCNNEAMKSEDFVDSGNLVTSPSKSFYRSLKPNFQSNKTEDEKNNFGIRNLENLPIPNDTIQSCQNCSDADGSETQVSPRVECECIHSLDVETGEGSLVCIVRNVPEVEVPDISKEKLTEFKSSSKQESLYLATASTSESVGACEVGENLNFNESTLEDYKNVNSEEETCNLPKTSNTESNSLIAESNDMINSAEIVDNLKSEFDSQLLFPSQDSGTPPFSPEVPKELTTFFSVESEAFQNTNSDPNVDSGCLEDTFISTTNLTPVVIEEPAVDAPASPEDVSISAALGILIPSLPTLPEDNLDDKISVTGEQISSLLKCNEIFQESFDSVESFDAVVTGSLQDDEELNKKKNLKEEENMEKIPEDLDSASISASSSTIGAEKYKLDKALRPVDSPRSKSPFENLSYIFTDKESGEIISSEEPIAIASNALSPISENILPSFTSSINVTEEVNQVIDEPEGNVHPMLNNSNSLVLNTGSDLKTELIPESESENKLAVSRKTREADDAIKILNEISFFEEAGIVEAINEVYEEIPEVSNKNENAHLSSEELVSNETEKLRSKVNFINSDQVKMDENSKCKTIEANSDIVDTVVVDVDTSVTNSLLNYAESIRDMPDLSADTTVFLPQVTLASDEILNRKCFEGFVQTESDHPNITSIHIQNSELDLDSSNSRQAFQIPAEPCDNIITSSVTIFPSIPMDNEDTEWILPDSEDNDAPYVLLSTQSNFHIIDDEGEEEDMKDTKKDGSVLKESVPILNQKLDEKPENAKEIIFSDKFEIDTVQNSLPFVECNNLISVDEFETSVDKDLAETLTVTMSPKQNNINIVSTANDLPAINNLDTVRNLEKINIAAETPNEMENYNFSEDILEEHNTMNVIELLNNNSCNEENLSQEHAFNVSNNPCEVATIVNANENVLLEVHRSEMSVDLLSGSCSYVDTSNLSKYATTDRTTGTSLVIEQFLDDDDDVENKNQTDTSTETNLETLDSFPEYVLNSQEYSNKNKDLHISLSTGVEFLSNSQIDSNLSYSSNNKPKLFAEKENTDLFSSESNETFDFEIPCISKEKAEEHKDVNNACKPNELDGKNTLNTELEDVHKTNIDTIVSESKEIKETIPPLNEEKLASVDFLHTTVNAHELNSDDPSETVDKIPNNSCQSDSINGNADQIVRSDFRDAPSEDVNENLHLYDSTIENDDPVQIDKKNEDMHFNLPTSSFSPSNYSPKDTSSVDGYLDFKLQNEDTSDRDNSKFLSCEFAQFNEKNTNVKLLGELSNQSQEDLNKVGSFDDTYLTFAVLSEENHDATEQISVLPELNVEKEAVTSINNNTSFLLENQKPDEAQIVIKEGDQNLNGDLLNNSCSDMCDILRKREILDNEASKKLLNQNASSGPPMEILSTEIGSVLNEDNSNLILKKETECKFVIKTDNESDENLKVDNPNQFFPKHLKTESSQELPSNNTSDNADPEKLLFMLLDTEEKDQFVSKDSGNGSDINLEEKFTETAHAVSSPQELSEIETEGLNTIDNELQFFQNIETLSDDSSEHSIYGRANTPVDEGSLQATNEILDIFLKHIEQQTDTELQEKITDNSLLYNQNADHLTDEFANFNDQALSIIPELEEPLESSDDESTSSSEIEFEYHQNPEDNKPKILLIERADKEKEFERPKHHTEEKHLDNTYSLPKQGNGDLGLAYEENEVKNVTQNIQDSNEFIIDQMLKIHKSDSISSGLSTLYEIEDIDEILIEDECEDETRQDNENNEEFLQINFADNGENGETPDNLILEESTGFPDNKTGNVLLTEENLNNVTNEQKLMDDTSEGETISSLADAFNKSVQQIARRMSEVEMELVSDSDKNDQDPTVCVTDTIETPVVVFDVNPSTENANLVNTDFVHHSLNSSALQSNNSTNLYIETFEQGNNTMLDNVNKNFLEYNGNPESFIITRNVGQLLISNNSNSDPYCDTRTVQMTNHNLNENTNEILTPAKLQNQYNLIHEKERKSIPNTEATEDLPAKYLVEAKRPNIIVNSVQVSPFTCVAYSESYKGIDDVNADGNVKYLKNLDTDVVNSFNFQNLRDEKYIEPILENNSSDVNSDVNKLSKDKKDSENSNSDMPSQNVLVSAESDVPKEGCVIIEDLDSPQNKSIQVIAATSQNFDEDLLIVDVETHKALLYETDRPRTQLAFIHQDNSSQIIESYNTSSESDDKELCESDSLPAKADQKLLSLSKLPQPWYSDSVVTRSRNTNSSTGTKTNLEVNCLKKTLEEETTESSSGSDMKVEDLLPLSCSSLDNSSEIGLKLTDKKIPKDDLHASFKEAAANNVENSNKNECDGGIIAGIEQINRHLDESNLELLCSNLRDGTVNDSHFKQNSDSQEMISFYKDPQFLVNLSTVSPAPVKEDILNKSSVIEPEINRQLCNAILLDTPPSTPQHNNEMINTYKIEVEESLFPNSVDMLDDEKDASVLTNQMSTSDIESSSSETSGPSVSKDQGKSVEVQDSPTLSKSDSLDSSISTSVKKKLSTEETEGSCLLEQNPTNKDSSTPEPCYTPDWDSDSESSSVLSSSSTSGEFDCNKPLPKVIAEPLSIPVKEETPENEDKEEESDEDDDPGESFKISTWDKDATPTRSSLKSPEKKTEQKKSVSFKKQKNHCIYQYPKEEQEWETEPTRQPWSSDIYSPDIDYTSYADWDLADEDIIEDIVEDFDINPSFENPPIFHLQENTLYKLSNIGDEDYMDSGSQGSDGVQFYSGVTGALNFQEFLQQYGNNPFYNPESDGEDFWATTSFNSSEFFVHGSEDPFEVNPQDSNSSSTLPQWCIEQEPYPADFHIANQDSAIEENMLESNLADGIRLNKNALYRYYDPNTGVNMFVGDVDEDLEALARSGYFNRDNEPSRECSSTSTNGCSNLIDALSLENNSSAPNTFISVKKERDFEKETTSGSLQEHSTSLQLLPYSNINQQLSFVLSQLNDNKIGEKVKNANSNLEEITFFNNIEEENQDTITIEPSSKAQ